MGVPLSAADALSSPPWGPSLEGGGGRGGGTLYTSVSVPFLRTEHSLTHSSVQDVGPMLCFPKMSERTVFKAPPVQS